MKTYLSIRIVKASNKKRAIEKIQNEDFVEDHKLSDVVITENEFMKISTKAAIVNHKTFRKT